MAKDIIKSILMLEGKEIEAKYRLICNIQHCAKSKFCAMRDRSKIIEPLLESYLQVLVTTRLNSFTSYLLAIV